MGHERVGTLPKSKRWRDIVSNLEAALSSSSPINSSAEIANITLKSIKNKYSNLHKDSGVRAGFQYLIALSSQLNGVDKDDMLDTNLENNPSPIRIIQKMSNWVWQNSNSTEYAELTCRAISDVIVQNSQEKSSQLSLFDDSSSAKNIWGRMNSGREFCKISKLFFSKFTEHYLHYILDRETSLQTNNIADRLLFDTNLAKHIDSITEHSDQTAKITQSFSAGWYNKHVIENLPSDKKIQKFLEISFGKLIKEFTFEEAR